MATNTYVALDKVTVSGSSTTSVTLSGISGLYTDLRLVISSQNQNSTNQPYIQFNADTSTGSTNYSTTSMRGDGSSAASSRHTNQNGWYPVPGPGVGTTGNFQPWLVDIMNYSNATTFKTGISRFNNASSIVSANAHLWRSTAAITSITITAESGAGYLVPGSTFSLYGIAAASVGAKATGGIISSDSQYYYHTFASTGTFTPLQSLTCDFLVVAGGGGGGSGGGAGGAGGYRTSVGTSGRNSSAESALSVTATAYTVTVGAGGAGGAAGSSAVGTVGSNSVFSTITSNGGGRGASSSSQNGGAGGSGGGTFSGASAAGTGTANQGFDNTAAFRSGGAGVGGTNSTYSGGAGLTSTLTGTALGGGGASSGDQSGQPTGTATAGGGAAATAYTTQDAGAGTANTGGGGGSGGGQTGVAVAGAGGSGGSGIVIIRYAK